ncbi:hypothetical protein H6F67_03875 [Microcoleus sp. FACHB-1515]|uniref:DUF6492 family protein n=1 Tax=Cyanophyceae TaxID=3028117 RepID=UPI001689DC4C|nr:DUF6492 family protein [Microcoleus sp. FACHB-1515]MBD2088991.1 hypothetical protein [Microcoleus sp. FACHB-1515]
MATSNLLKDTGILIRTYHKDAERLFLCLKSIQCFAHVMKVTVVCPSSSKEVIEKTCLQFDWVELKTCANYQNDFIGQQITKLLADMFVDSNFILHIDSDCIFTQQVDEADLFFDKKPILYFRPYSFFYEQGINMPWQTITSKFLKRQTDYEFMRRFPLVYDRTAYSSLRSYYNEQFNDDIEEVLSKVSGDYFSEFNLLGSFVYYFRPDLAHFIDTNQGPVRPAVVRQGCLYQSRDDRSLSTEERELLEKILQSEV